MTAPANSCSLKNSTFDGTFANIDVLSSFYNCQVEYSHCIKKQIPGILTMHMDMWLIEYVDNILKNIYFLIL